MAVLFSLVPRNGEALSVLHCNPTHHEFMNGKRLVLSFGHLPSKSKGRFATFGRHESNDIRLPSGTPENYRNYHLFFYLAPSGELVLRDLTPRLTAIEVHNATAEEQKLYQLQGAPRLRVIPRAERPMSLVFGTNTQFLFLWRIPLTGAGVQGNLTRRAQLLAVPGMSITLPRQDESMLEPSNRYELRSRYTPTVASQRRPQTIQCHKYEVLGEGTFGVVSKAVDLGTGDIWAVKEIKAEMRDDRWRAAFKREVEIIADLRHVSLPLSLFQF
jgi:hypothetical protein